MKKGRGGLKPINIERARRQAEKHALDRRSPEWKALKKAVRERSGGRCERTFDLGPTFNYLGHESRVMVRCPSSAVDVHHTRYTKVRAREALTDLLHVCRECHAELEAASPWRASRRRVLTTRGERT